MHAFAEYTQHRPEAGVERFGSGPIICPHPGGMRGSREALLFGRCEKVAFCIRFVAVVHTLLGERWYFRLSCRGKLFPRCTWILVESPRKRKDSNMRPCRFSVSWMRPLTWNPMIYWLFVVSYLRLSEKRDEGKMVDAEFYFIISSHCYPRWKNMIVEFHCI